MKQTESVYHPLPADERFAVRVGESLPWWAYLLIAVVAIPCGLSLPGAFK